MKLRAKAYLKIAAEDWRKKYDYVWSFSEGLATVKLNNKWGFVDKRGKEVVPLKYDGAWDFHEGLAPVKLGRPEPLPGRLPGQPLGPRKLEWGPRDKWGFIDKTGKEVIPPKYDSVWNFHEGLAEVKLNDKYGFVDKTGKEVVPPKYVQVGDFFEALAAVKLDGKWGFVDKKGNVVIPLKYDWVGWFEEGLAEVDLDGKWGFVDKQGREIPKKYLTAVLLGGDIDRILELDMI